MSALLVEAWADCSGCGRRVNLGSLSTSATCEECGSKTELAEPWQKLGAPITAHDEHTKGPLHVRTEACKGSIPCPVCSHAHAITAVLATDDGAAIECKCGERLARRAAGGGVPWPRGTSLFGEAEEVSHTLDAVVIACAKCGASLDATGESRSVACKFCEATNLLDEAAWRRLHPIRRIRRFAVLVDDEAAAAEAKEASRAHEAAREAREAAHEQNVERRTAKLNALARPRPLPTWADRARVSGALLAVALLMGGVVMAIAAFPHGIFGAVICGLFGAGILAPAARARRTANTLMYGEIVAGEVRKATRVAATSKAEPRVRLKVAYRAKDRDHSVEVELPGGDGAPARNVKEGMRIFVAVDGDDPSRAAIYALA